MVNVNEELSSRLSSSRLDSDEPELLSFDDERTGEFRMDRQQISYHSEDVLRKHHMVSDRCDAGKGDLILKSHIHDFWLF